MYVVNMACRGMHEQALFISLDKLDNIAILLDEDNDLEEEQKMLMK